MVVGGLSDVAKGAVGPLLAGSDRPSLAAAAGAAAVCGHNWSPFLKGEGGRGISPAMGALLPQAWAGSVLLLTGLALGRIGRDTALGCLVADAALVPLMRVTGGRRAARAAAAVLVPMIAKRLAGNGRIPSPRPPGLWRTRLLYDRDPEPAR
jgi:glycerol-3-phosphate acyltransferase PlsY